MLDENIGNLTSVTLARPALAFLILLFMCTSNPGTVLAPWAFFPRDSRGAATQDKPSNLREVIPDVMVQDQHGLPIRFYTDLVKGKVFVINFIYTTCRGTCLVLGHNFATLQRMHERRPGREVQLISISIDPATDTPKQLKILSKNMRARRGWTFVTGEKASMEKLLRALMGDLPRKGGHSDGVLIGDDSGGVLERRWGLATAETLKEAVEEILAASRARRQGTWLRRPFTLNSSSVAAAGPVILPGPPERRLKTFAFSGALSE